MVSVTVCPVYKSYFINACAKLLFYLADSVVALRVAFDVFVLTVMYICFVLNQTLASVTVRTGNMMLSTNADTHTYLVFLQLVFLGIT